MSAHRVQWVAASPLWSWALNSGLDPAMLGERMRAPALLRFEHDKFMDELAQTLAEDPSGLAARVATKVTYRLPAPGQEQPPPPTELKLFQPAHGHFHLVSASLTCRLPGLPDHELDTAARERVAFVLRRKDDDGSEWAWVSDPATAGAMTWLQLGTDDSSPPEMVAPGEDLRPLFPLRYQNGDRMRRVYVGLVPTSNGEAFKAGPQLSPLAGSDGVPGSAPGDPRPAALATKVTDPLRAIAAAKTDPPGDVGDVGKQQAIVDAERTQLVEASRFLLVDFAEFLLTNLPDLWTALGQDARPSDAATAALFDALGRRADPTAVTTWREALLDAWEKRLALYGDATGSLPAELNLHGSALSGDDLDALVVAALPRAVPAGAAGAATSLQGDVVPAPPIPKLDPRGRWHYWIRCVYRRPECPAPRQDLVSEPSERFQIAGFFDLDAPGRPIHISLPIDTGIADLRKLRKNVSFLLSDQLRAQMNRVTNLKDALNGQFADGGSVDLGLICSFSIPVITICALIVLMIFIQLLNIVFWWLPFLRICFPIGLKGGSS